MKVVRAALKITAGLIGGLLLVLAIGFGLLQTGPGQDWLARRLSSTLSDAQERVVITGLRGFVPFDMRFAKIAFVDAQGQRLGIDDAALAIAPADLLSGRLTLRQVRAQTVRIERPSANSSGIDLGALLHPPLALRIEHLQIDRLELGPALLGQPVVATLSGSGAVGGGTAAADLDLRRIDGTPGQARLHLALGGAPLRLELAGNIAEPSGKLLAAALGRNETLPLTLHLTGAGPLADWHGQLAAKAGTAASVDADFRVIGDGGYRLAAEGEARLAPLLPPQLRPLLGERDGFAASLGFDGSRITLDTLTVTLPAATLAAHGRFDRASAALGGEASLDMPDLAPLSPLAGSSIEGAGKAKLTLRGTLPAPTAQLTVTGDSIGIDGNRAASTRLVFDLGAAGDSLAASTPIDIAGSGTLDGMTLASGALPADLGEHIELRLAARLDRTAGQLAVSDLTLSDGDSTLSAQGQASMSGATGTAHLDIPDIARFAGATLKGALALNLDFRAGDNSAATASLSGALRQPQSGIAPVDALLGHETTLAASLERHADGTLAAEKIEVNAANGRFTGTARCGADGRVDADYRLDLPRLAALDPEVAGAAVVTGKLDGPVDGLAASAKLSVDALTAGAVHLDHVDATLDMADLAKRSGRIDATFRSKALSGTASAAGALDDDALRVSQLRLDAAGTRLDGALTYHFASGIVEGRLDGNAPDLAPWSALAGAPVSGRAQVKAALGTAKGQSIDLTLDGSNIAWGGETPLSLQRVTASARLSDLFGKPAGRATLQAEHAKLGRVALDRLRLRGESNKPGRFTLDGEACGNYAKPFALATGATITLAAGAVELRVMRLTGHAGDEAVRLQRPLRVTRRGSEIAFADLALGLGGGRITGAGSVKGAALSLHLLGEKLPVRGLAALAGQQGVTGSLGFELTLGGTRQKPEGEIIVDGEQLRFAAATRPDLPPVGIVASGTWRGGQVDAKGRIASANSALGFTAMLPLTLDPDHLVPHLPPDGRLALHLEGDGELANIADLLPLGEDRLGGRFTIDVSVAGTVAAPVASGRFSVRDGHYENLVVGTRLTGVSFDLVGDRDQLVLQRFTAGDGHGGTLAVTGAVSLAAASGPEFAFAGQLARFRALQRDEATATVSGDVRLTGNVAAPRLAAQLRVDHAELRVPERLPQNVRPIEVTVINSATGQVLSTPSQEASSSPLLSLALDVTVTMPGQVFVRGRGLDSEWRGRLTITGATAAPSLDGRLEVVRGTYDFLGKSATLNRGTITFVGGEKIDPAIDIQAQINSSNVIAIVRITGTATQPTIHLASQPPLPQDEILARVLFGTSISQVSAAQGLEIAQAAAALATGGGPGVLDRIRQGLGLDRLSLGAANNTSPFATIGVPAYSNPAGVPNAFGSTGVGTSPLPPGTAGAGGVATGAAVSAGKYVANGVYVGVTQGVTGGSSSVDAQIDVTRHISIDTTAGQNNGAGVGVNWKLDY